MTRSPVSSSAVRALGVVFLVGWAFLAAVHTEAVRLAPGWVVLLVAVAVALARPVAARLPAALARLPTRVYVGCAAALAIGLSYALLRGPLRGHGLSIDASVYLLEARALAHFSFGVPISEPRLAFGGRFLFEGPSGALYGVFPPGYPLFLVPFVWLGVPHLAGPVVSALLVVAQYALARVATKDELAARVAVALSLPSCARAFETSDLLSHAFVATLSAAAVALALRLTLRGSTRIALLAGACAGWALSARLLDGLVVLGVVFAVVGVSCARGRVPWRALGAIGAGALPFVLLIAFEQKVATGSFTRPTQSEYFVRSDYPPTCHRLGFGVDVGCAVEHPDMRALHGADGYGLDDAARVTRERARVLGEDLFAWGPLLLLAFVPLVARPRGAEALLAAFIVALTLAYGLFYYGNAPLHGARHLFPAAPFAYALVARALVLVPHRTRGFFDAAHARGAAVLATLSLVLAGERGAWVKKANAATIGQGTRSDLRRVVARHHLEQGILKSRDPVAVIAGTDPWADAPSRFIVLDDRSGLQELRRARPDLPMINAMERDEIGTFPGLRAPPPGVLVELERAWPSFVRPSRLATRTAASVQCCGVTGASGESVLEVFVSEVGATLDIPFDVAVAGRYALRIDGLVGPDYGAYELEIDDVALPAWDGYAKEAAMKRGVPAEARPLARGRHVLRARCVGRAPQSRGYLAAFDALVGVSVP